MVSFKWKLVELGKGKTKRWYVEYGDSEAKLPAQEREIEMWQALRKLETELADTRERLKEMRDGKRTT